MQAGGREMTWVPLRCPQPDAHAAWGGRSIGSVRPAPRETYVQHEAGESPNDRNDRAIRVAAAWYQARLPPGRVLLLTNDADNRRKAQVCLSVRQPTQQRRLCEALPARSETRHARTAWDTGGALTARLIPPPRRAMLAWTGC
jgi:PIN domain